VKTSELLISVGESCRAVLFIRFSHLFVFSLLSLPLSLSLVGCCTCFTCSYPRSDCNPRSHEYHIGRTIVDACICSCLSLCLSDVQHTCTHAHTHTRASYLTQPALLRENAYSTSTVANESLVALKQTIASFFW
jgi:hypothetical protein